MKKLAVLVLITLSFVCALPFALRAEDLVIGWSGPLTGNSAVVGIDSVPAIELAFEEANTSGGVNGRVIKLAIEDDQYNTQKAVSAFNKLTTIDNAKIILASTYGGIFATAELAIQRGVLVIDPLDCNEEIARLPENTLCIATKTESIAEAMAQDIKGNNLASVVILLEESDGWMQLIARGLSKALLEANIRVRIESSLPTETDYRIALSRAKSVGASALVLLGNDQMGLAVKQSTLLGYSPILYGIGSMMSPGFRSLSGDAIEGARVSSWLAPRSDEYLKFIKRFVAKTGRAPALELATLPSYDTAKLLVQCLRKTADENNDPEDVNLIRNCMLQYKDYAGLSGTITFDGDGAVRSIHEQLYQIKEGELSPLH